MSDELHIVRRKLLTLEEEYRAWDSWHCCRFGCKKHMCAKRGKTLDRLHSDIQNTYGTYRTMLAFRRQFNYINSSK